MTAIDLQNYLRRLGYSGSTAPTVETLREMHRAHFYNVPFENLDISRQVPIKVGDAHTFEKVVSRRRGGFCLELNSLFAQALRQMGYRVDVLSARVFGEGTLGEAMSHMTLIAHLDEPWLVDVGFGGRIAGPLRMVPNLEQAIEGRIYVVAKEEDYWFVTAREPGTPNATYLFKNQPRQFSEFNSVCFWLQTSKDSRFTGGDMISLAKPSGRVSLAKKLLVVTEGETRSESPVTTDAEERELLQSHFGVTL